MDLNKLSKEIHEQNLDRGWWDIPRSPLEIHALIHSEISEATEAVRNNMPPIYKVITVDYRDCSNEEIKIPKDVEWENEFWKTQKPEGEAVELADALIRILDYAGYRGWDMDRIVKEKLEYNATRGYRHGNKAY